MTPRERSELERAEEESAQQQREARRAAANTIRIEEIREILGGTIISEEEES